MYYELYIDILFLENLMLDILLLWLMRRFLGYTTTWARICSSAVCGSIGACLFWVVPFFRTIPGLLLSYLGMSGFMVWLGFQIRKWSALCEATGAMYMLGLLFVGSVSFMAELFRGKRVIGTKGTAFVLATILWMVLVLGGIWIKRRQERLCRVTICFRGSIKRVAGLWDTGNQLWDPLHRKPVHVIERNILEPEIESEEGIYPISYHSIGNPNGTMEAVVAEYMMVEYGGMRHVAYRPVLALAEEQLSGRNAYVLIVNPGIIDK